MAFKGICLSPISIPTQAPLMSADPRFIFDAETPFRERMLRVARHQYGRAGTLQRFWQALGWPPDAAPKSEDWPPLLPVEAFREPLYDDLTEAPLVFRSSGTTGMQRSMHPVADPGLYRQAIFEAMRSFYPLQDFVILAYTPGYSENPDSSLIWMLRELITAETSGLSRFLPLNTAIPPDDLRNIEASGKRLLLFGAAFGLIDLAERFPVQLPQGTLIMETGGMKTHRREMSRDELHLKLAAAFGMPPVQVHSEYGMTELLSQAYADGSGWFRCPHWMQISIRNPENPLLPVPPGGQGLIGIIDLANFHSCSFILTGDRGEMLPDGRFRVLGRYIPENLRGCNFLIDRD